ncbi:hypothetical protein [Pseudomonas sp. St290]|uniref:hypothetical protein n=1 Tax=Pseudomonas sp. St290 TaxID=1602166 RepID=UPI001BB32761|nr:hypothetical protein [Pseudomonas sp. St290]BBH34878.1 hypothetical protein PBDP_4415 [Pseudomonas sp. St290]
MKKLSDLHEVFVSFKAEKIEGTSIVFFNKGLKLDLVEADALSRYSYVVGGGAGKKEERRSKIFFAERYGGDGILRNGGGGRCGFDGDFQLKGIGPNQLVAKDAVFADGNGLMSLNSAIYETVWSEIINIALPYGAARSVAVIDTGLKFECENKTYLRGLLVRMPTVRPAHFISAIYFRERHVGALSNDAKRVRLAVSKLVEFLPLDHGGCLSGSLHERLYLGLRELAKRYARQFAAARVKQIIHFNVTPSNLTLDGAWIDFSSVRIFSDLIPVDRDDYERFVGEHIPAIESIRNICYYLSKYKVVGLDDANEIAESSVDEFLGEYDRQFNLHCAMRMGFPAVLLNHVLDSGVFIEFAAVVKELLVFDDLSMRFVTNETGWKGYECWGFRLYAALLRGKVLGVEPDFIALNVEPTLLKALVIAYGNFFDFLCCKARSVGVSFRNLVVGMAINVVRVNHVDVALTGLEGSIDDVVGSGNDSTNRVGRLVEDVVGVACLQFYNEDGVRVPYWVSRSLEIWFDIASGFYVLKQTGQDLYSVKCLSRFNVQNPEVLKAIAFYAGIWDVVDEGGR